MNIDPVYDLHSHSHCSDGDLPPEELVALAHSQSVTTLALTDHDTTSGIAAATAAAARLSATGQEIRIVPGIELSAQWRGRGIHVVALAFVPESEAMSELVQAQERRRRQRAVTIDEKLQQLGIKGALEGASHHARGESIGRPHFAQYLVDAGHVGTINQAFNKYLGAGKAGDVKQQWPEVADVTTDIVAGGGIAVLAHPHKYNLTRTKLYELLQTFKSAGGEAIEVVSGNQDKTVTDTMVRAAADFSLYASCGSDFHTPKAAWQMVGKMAPLPELTGKLRWVWQHPVFQQSLAGC